MPRLPGAEPLPGGLTGAPPARSVCGGGAAGRAFTSTATTFSDMTAGVLDIAFEDLQRDRPPVMLWGGLSLLRSLRLASVSVVLATSDPADPALRSRHVAGICRLPPAHAGERSLVDALVRAGRQLHEALGRRIPLFYGNDEQLSLVYGHRDELTRHYLLTLNDPALGLALLEKDRFEALARVHRLPVPRSWPMGDGAERALAEASGPKVVKPRRKTHFEESALRRDVFSGQGKAIVFRDGRELLSRLPVVHAGEISVQDYVPGPDRRLVSFHGYADDEGRVLAWFVGRKIRSFPAHTGESSFLELVHDDALVHLGLDVAARLGLKGIFKMDFKQDERDGAYYLLEINARFSLWSYLGAANGVNLPKVAYDHLVYGKAPPATAYSTRYKWLKLALDLKAFRELRASGQLTAGEWLRSLAFSPAVYHCFAWKDPGPLLAVWGRRASRLLRRWHVTGS
jgi:predicted ATP-grasp superfamily ATP-dependent carboligase